MEDQAKYEVTEKQSIETALATRGGLIPSNLEQLWRLAVIMAKSGLMPKGLQTPEAVCVAVQMGLEVGLTPMQAVQNIAVINGRPSVWGDAGLALVEASGKLEDFKETIEEKNGTVTATCWAKRKNRPTPVERTFTTIDAKNAGLAGKDIWKQYPKRMTQMRARWWVLKDLFADVLKGLKSAEEMDDIIDVTPPRKGNGRQKPEPVIDSVAVEEFDKAASTWDNQEHLQEYLEICAEHFKKTLDELKQDIVLAGEFDDFKDSFDKWVKENKAEKPKKGKKKEEPPKHEPAPETKECPLVMSGSNVVPVSECKTCSSREGCPEWDSPSWE